MRSCDVVRGHVPGVSCCDLCHDQGELQEAVFRGMTVQLCCRVISDLLAQKPECILVRVPGCLRLSSYPKQRSPRSG